MQILSKHVFMIYHVRMLVIADPTQEPTLAPHPHQPPTPTFLTTLHTPHVKHMNVGSILGEVGPVIPWCNSLFKEVSCDL